MKIVPTGIENFKELIDKDACYVDKTNLIEKVLKEKVVLYTRPRRFGKTLNMSMLYYFFSNKEKENAYLFDGLNISKNKEALKHQNQYPVIFISLKDMKESKIENQLVKFSYIIARLLDQFEDILDDDIFNEREKKLLKRYHLNTASKNELSESLLTISLCLRKYYHQDCSLNNLKLIYDVRQESLENYEIEQTLLKVCLKEGYAILHDFIESNQYSKYLQFQDLDISSPISFYYHLNSTNKILQNIIQLIKKG